MYTLYMYMYACTVYTVHAYIMIMIYVLLIIVNDRRRCCVWSSLLYVGCHSFQDQCSSVSIKGYHITGEL